MPTSQAVCGSDRRSLATTDTDSGSSTHADKVHTDACKEALEKSDAEVFMANHNIVKKMQNLCRIELSDNNEKVNLNVKRSKSIDVPKQALLVTPPCRYSPFSTSCEKKYSFHFDPELGKYVVGQKRQTMPRNIKTRSKTCFKNVEDLVWL